MNGITKFFIEDVRCFAKQQEFNIRPLTFLVGENSTGKSSMLGCFQALIDYLGSIRLLSNPDFNCGPYSMGSFSNIVREQESKKIPSFKLGFRFASPPYLADKEIKNVRLTATFVEKKQSTEPVIRQLQVEFVNSGRISFKHSESKKYRDPEFRVISATKDNRFTIGFNFNRFPNPFLVLDYFLFDLLLERKKKTPQKELALKRFLLKIYGSKTQTPSRLFRVNLANVISFAPVQSRPERTYNAQQEREDPEGSNVPMTLMRMHLNEKEKWKKLKKELAQFGEESGLFENINVKRYGGMSEPFALQIRTRGSTSNIIDVGYGVSQILPILVNVLQAERSSKFLLQQPEVHLHPKGQAALSSLLVGIIENKKHSFIVETHSDYMIDRTRIEIRKGNIKPKDVSLIYMKPKKDHVETHNIEFDKNGEFKEVPESYRDFFLEETDRLLGYED